MGAAVVRPGREGTALPSRGWSRLRGPQRWPGVLAALLLALVGPVPLLAAGPTVSIRDFVYQPATITVVAGQTITWHQEDIEQHTVSACTASACPSVSSLAFDSGLLTQGQSFSFTFTEAGTYPYYCKVHTYAIMHATVVVTASVATGSPTKTSAPPSPTPAPTVGPTRRGSPSLTALPTPSASPSSTIIPTPPPATLGPTPPPTATASPSAGSPADKARGDAVSGRIPVFLGALILLGLAALGLGIVITRARRDESGPPEA